MDSLVLIQDIQNEDLYLQTINQLNKDFKLANIDKEISHLVKPIEFKIELEQFVLDLLTNSYDSYLNLVYRVDIQESELMKMSGKILADTVSEIAFLIIKGEFQKVWFKKRYSN